MKAMIVCGVLQTLLDHIKTQPVVPRGKLTDKKLLSDHTLHAHKLELTIVVMVFQK